MTHHETAVTCPLKTGPRIMGAGQFPMAPKSVTVNRFNPALKTKPLRGIVPSSGNIIGYIDGE